MSLHIDNFINMKVSMMNILYEIIYERFIFIIKINIILFEHLKITNVLNITMIEKKSCF